MTYPSVQLIIRHINQLWWNIWVIWLDLELFFFFFMYFILSCCQKSMASSQRNAFQSHTAQRPPAEWMTSLIIRYVYIFPSVQTQQAHTSLSHVIGEAVLTAVFVSLCVTAERILPKTEEHGGQWCYQRWAVWCCGQHDRGGETERAHSAVSCSIYYVRQEFSQGNFEGTRHHNLCLTGLGTKFSSSISSRQQTGCTICVASFSK